MEYYLIHHSCAELSQIFQFIKNRIALAKVSLYYAFHMANQNMINQQKTFGSRLNTFSRNKYIFGYLYYMHSLQEEILQNIVFQEPIIIDNKKITEDVLVFLLNLTVISSDDYLENIFKTFIHLFSVFVQQNEENKVDDFIKKYDDMYKEAASRINKKYYLQRATEIVEEVKQNKQKEYNIDNNLKKKLL